MLPAYAARRFALALKQNLSATAQAVADAATQHNKGCFRGTAFETQSLPAAATAGSLQVLCDILEPEDECMLCQAPGGPARTSYLLVESGTLRESACPVANLRPSRTDNQLVQGDPQVLRPESEALQKSALLQYLAKVCSMHSALTYLGNSCDIERGESDALIVNLTGKRS